MKATLSVLISELSGKAGDVVGAKWKGRQYFRRRVTPANPNTAAQQAQRTGLTIVTGSWKTLVSKITDSWTAPAAPYLISGFNLFAKENIAEEVAGNWEHYTSADLTRAAVESVAAAPGGPGIITITWSQGDAAATDVMHIAYRTQEETDVTVDTDAGTTADAETYAITGLSNGEVVCVYVTNRDADDDFAASSYVLGTAGGA